MNPELPRDCIGCMHAAKDWGEHPCSKCQDGEFYKSTEPRPELSDLEVWRQAYNAAIPPGANEDIVKGIADCALEAYRAKREELGK